MSFGSRAANDPGTISLDEFAMNAHRLEHGSSETVRAPILTAPHCARAQRQDERVFKFLDDLQMAGLSRADRFARQQGARYAW